METSEENPHIFLDRSTRATRGKRISKLIDDEIEEDELFWNQDALKEEENDDNYQEEAEAADEFDSDFDEDEPDADEVVENNVEERTKKKRPSYPGNPVTKKKIKKKAITSIQESLSKDENQAQPSTDPDHADANDDAESERVVRKSTRTSVIVRQAERDAIRAAMQATAKPIKRKKEGEERRMTQEEMLLEAAQTEIMNKRNLDRVLAREEEVKKKAIVHKAVYNGPQIRYLSRNGYSYLEFSKGASFQSDISTNAVPYPEKAVCVVTGLPAKYRDPKTGLPYATIEAFKTIRKRFLDENNNVRKQMYSGDLRDSLTGKGFMRKRKRSQISKKPETSHTRRMSRFLRLSSPESDDSD